MTPHIRTHQTQQFQLALTPALQLSLKVLQLPLMQLDAFLHEELENNPVLELAGSLEEADGRASESQSSPAPRELDDGVQDPWSSSGTFAGQDEDEETYRPEPASQPSSLYEHLAFQIHCMGIDALQAALAERVIGWLDPDGYLRTPLEEIAAAEGVELGALTAVLDLIHRMDPAGVGARNLRECLLIQLDHHHQRDNLAWRILQEQFELFTKRHPAQLAARLKVPLAEIEEACRQITYLDPKPARGFSTTPIAFQTPDLIIQKSDGSYQVDLNDAELPHLRISRQYRQLLRQRDTAEDAKQFIRERVRQGMWVIKAIRQRRDTLLSIGRCLVEVQRDYLDYGISYLNPLTQHEVAQRIGCHASTISRAIAGKTVQTPYGSLPMEAFFGGGIVDPEHAERRMSPKSIHAELQDLITREDPCRPLSDQALLSALKTRGYPIARRTVAKYRTELRILPAHLRRRAVSASPAPSAT